jgi:hypothetical protein
VVTGRSRLTLQADVALVAHLFRGQHTSLLREAGRREILPPRAFSASLIP